MEDGEMKILEVGNSDRKMESSVHDMRRRASSGVPDPPNSIKRSLEFDEEAVETRPSQIIDENVESPKHQSKKGRDRNRGCSQKSHRMQTRNSKVGEKSSQMCQFEQREESESIKKGWNLEVEITKEIEKGSNGKAENESDIPTKDRPMPGLQVIGFEQEYNPMPGLLGCFLW
ncbi:hypothetical protein Q3G72_034639 [Acer saccharum]|nr:hypothetical protein Q3G72_034639 [Acer saccharum]